MALGEGSTGVAGDKRRPDMAARVSQWARVAAPRTLFSNHGQTERRMVLVQWAIMPLVLAGCVLPPPRYNEPPTHVWIAAIIMAVHPLLYTLFTRLRELRGTWPAEWVDMLLTATDVTV